MLLGTGGHRRPCWLWQGPRGGAGRARQPPQSRECHHLRGGGGARTQVIVNTSPVGMYPNNGECLVALENYPRLEAVLDVIYNPFRTALLQQAEARGLPAVNGMLMLVARAKYAAEHFSAGRSRTRRSTASTGSCAESCPIWSGGHARQRQKAPGEKPAPSCWASALWIWTTFWWNASAGPSAASFPRAMKRPSATWKALWRRSWGRKTAVIATGGGAVLRAQNVRALRQNGVVVYIDRPLGQLAVGGAAPFPKVRRRWPPCMLARAAVAAACDARVENDGPFESVAEAIKERFYEILDH